MVKYKKPTTRMRQMLLAGEFAALGAGAVILLVFLASTLDGLLIRQGQGAAVITSMLVELANTDRASNSVHELTVSPTLTAIAQMKANDMAAKSYFAHVSPEGRDPWYWFAQGGYKFSYAGENLAVDFSDSADVERAWMNSPTHRANLLNAHFSEIGIATAVGTYKGHQTTFVVQEFGTPAHAAQAAPVKNVTEPTASPTELAVATTVETPKPGVAPVPTTPKPAANAALAVATPANVATSSPVTVASPTAVLGTSVTGLAAPEPTAYQRLGLISLWNVFAASPATTLRYAYYLFGLLILIALVIETGIEIRHHHIKHVALVAVLFVLMGSLFMVADHLVFTDPVLLEAAAIQAL